MLFGALVVTAIARLRPSAPVLIAVSSALTFPAVYFFVLRGQLQAEALASPLLSPMMQVTRATSLLLGGSFAYFVARGLRRAIGKADSAVRGRDLFAKYRIERRIAAGGMGTVFEAVYCPEGGFERRVAVKRIHPHLAELPRFVEAFRR
jgi:serine/threonine-protein kinase